MIIEITSQIAGSIIDQFMNYYQNDIQHDYYNDEDEKLYAEFIKFIRIKYNGLLSFPTNSIIFKDDADGNWFLLSI